jgi:hypothetical protein
VPSNDVANRLPDVTPDPAVDAVRDDEVEPREIAREQVVERRCVESDVANRQRAGALCGGCDAVGIEVARVKLGARKSRRVNERRLRVAAAEFEIPEGFVESARNRAANRGDVVQPDRRQFAKVRRRVDGVSDVAACDAGVRHGGFP